MLTLSKLALLASLGSEAFALSVPSVPRLYKFLGFAQAQKQQQPLQGTFDAWIQQQEQVALDKLLANIAPGGSNVEGRVVPGTVIASPSREKPDYWYQCELGA
jgi:glucoamylase